MIRCLTGTRFSMTATVLRYTEQTNLPASPQPTNWTNNQDPITGEVMNNWQPGITTPDNPATTTINETKIETIPCLVRGIVDGGIRVAGTTERFGDTYQNIDIVKLWTPPNVVLTKRDRIVDIKGPNGIVIWRDEEYFDNRATTFNINGVTPLFDAFNKHIENFILLERVTPNG